MNPPDDFERWLLRNYGFHANGVPIRNMPPRFLTGDGFFDVEACERWQQSVYDSEYVPSLRASILTRAARADSVASPDSDSAPARIVYYGRLACEVRGSGDPFYHPSKMLNARARVVAALCETEADGKRYFRVSGIDAYRPLRTSNDYALLNHSIEQHAFHLLETVRQRELSALVQTAQPE